jgi:heptosyltransferase-1
LHTFPLPPGSPEGNLPDGDFVLASPLAGWGAKQWPIENYTALAHALWQDCRIPLVLNVPQPIQVEGVATHVSGIRGLIHATRKAVAVVGVDSGPMHLAAAIGKPGVAIFGPTDPARNGPYGESFRVLRTPDAVTTYRRTADPDASMRAISPDQVWAALEAILSAANRHG